jgi:hypothetical protein
VCFAIIALAFGTNPIATNAVTITITIAITFVTTVGIVGLIEHMLLLLLLLLLVFGASIATAIAGCHTVSEMTQLLLQLLNVCPGPGNFPLRILVPSLRRPVCYFWAQSCVQTKLRSALCFSAARQSRGKNRPDTLPVLLLRVVQFADLAAARVQDIRCRLQHANARLLLACMDGGAALWWRNHSLCVAG